MKRWKSIVAILVVTALALVALPVGFIGSAFVGISPIVDGQQLGPITTVKDGYVAMYLGEAPDGSLYLIDAGMDTEATALKAALTARGRSLSDVRALFLTHGHGDHIGGCAALPDALVYALSAEVPVITGAAAPKGPLPRWMKNDGSCHVDGMLEDGDAVDVGGTLVTAYAMPGHTAGSAAYLVDGVLLMGDAASATSEGAVRGPPWVFSDDTAQAWASIAALGARVPSDVRWVAFGHTGPLAGPGALQALAPR